MGKGKRQVNGLRNHAGHHLPHRLVHRVSVALNDARFWRAFAGWTFWATTAVWILAEIFGWVYETAFVTRVSMPALQLACLSWWQSGRVEVKQQDDADVKDVLAKLDENDSR